MAKIKMKKGPLPVSGAKMMADKMVEKAKSVAASPSATNVKPMSGTVTEKVMYKEFIPSNVSAMRGPKGKSKMSTKELVAEGLFAEKDGELMPTAKYQALKKSGGLTKYGIQ